MHRRLAALPVLSLLALGLSLPTVALAAAGSPDAAFGSAGRIRVMHDGAYVMTGLAVQKDGRIVLSAQHGLGRFLADGSVDTSFAGDGYIDSVFGVPDSSVYQAVIQSDGKIVAVGATLAHPDATLAVARFLPSGERDLAFGDNGIVLVPGNELMDEALAVALQRDGRLVVAGHSEVPGGTRELVLLRFLADGSLDTSFNGTGRLQVPFGSDGGGAKSVAVQPDGRIVVAAGGYGSLAGGAPAQGGVLRFTADGQPDASFGTDGLVLLDLNVVRGWSGASVIVQPDGKILVSGTDPSGLGVARLSADGSLDAGFGSGGTTVLAIPGTSFLMSARGLQLQPDGRILAMAEGYPFSGLIRLLPDGSPDNSFGSDGSQLIPPPDWAGQIFANGLALQPDSKFLAAGTIMVSSAAGGGGAHESIWRFLARDTDGDAVAEPWDLTPDAFQFQAPAAATGTRVTAPVTIGGLGAGVKVPVVVSGGEYALNGGGYGDNLGYAGNGDTVTLRFEAGSTPQLTLGGMHAPNNLRLILGATVTGGVTEGGVTPPALPALRVRNVVPQPESLNVGARGNVMAVFERRLNPATLTSESFRLICNGARVAATVELAASGTVARLYPQGGLPSGAICTATIGTAIRSTTGAALAEDLVWRFMTRIPPRLRR